MPLSHFISPSELEEILKPYADRIEKSEERLRVLEQNGKVNEEKQPGQWLTQSAAHEHYLSTGGKKIGNRQWRNHVEGMIVSGEWREGVHYKYLKQANGSQGARVININAIRAIREDDRKLKRA